MKKMNPFEKALEAIIGFYDGSYDVEKKYDKEGILHVNVKCGGITIPYWIVYNLSTYFEKKEEKQGLKVNSSLTEKKRVVNGFHTDVIDSIMGWENIQAMKDKIEKAMGKEDEFTAITEKMHIIYLKKNHDYGKSFDKTMDEFGLTSAVIRMNDKLERLKTLRTTISEITAESIDDTLMDLASYAVMTLMYLHKKE